MAEKKKGKLPYYDCERGMPIINGQPYDYAESPEPDSPQWNAERRGSILQLLVPVLVEMKRRGEDLSKWEALASSKLAARRSDEPFNDGTAILFSPFSLN